MSRPGLGDELAAYPVAIIGAGPVGLAAAAHLAEKGIDFVVLEAGPAAGASVTAWGHVRLFSPWEFLVDAAAGRLLDAAGWDSPQATRIPYGRDLVADYLLPLAATPEIAPRVRYNSAVTAVTRRGMDRTRSAGRGSTPFLLRVASSETSTELLARAVIDTSGTYNTPNPLAAGGLPLAQADEVRDSISAALPDVLGADRDAFAGKHTLVVGAGHSAANTLLALAALAREVPGTTISWAIRGAAPVRVYGSTNDELPGRGQLGADTHRLVRDGVVTLLDRFEINDVVPAADGRVATEGRDATGGHVAVVGRRGGSPARVEVDRVVSSTGFRPDLSLTREIRLSLDEIVEAPRALAPLIDPNLHSCGSVPPHGVVELSHPERNYFVAGMKSYGRAPTFLLATGYEQVRSIADELAGDHVSARQVQLVLPETGVCSTGSSDSSVLRDVSVPSVPGVPGERRSLAVSTVGGGSRGCCA
jgi:cation diffusion facilitator CzcD-associated flavoprotein CzcO